MLETQWGDRRLRSTYLGHMAANRKIFAQYDQQIYHSIPGIPKPFTPKKSSKERQTPKRPFVVRINPECARLNLWNLVQQDDAHLYAVTLQLLTSCYGSSLFPEEPARISLFLKALIKQLKISQGPICLEKIDMEPVFQKTYYLMLKGSKKWDPQVGVGYPSLLDLIKVEENPTKLCVMHAHLGVCMALFGEKVGLQVYERVHEDPSFVRTEEWVEQLYAASHQRVKDPSMFAFLELNNTVHKKNQRITLVADDAETHVSLRKTLRR